MYLDLYILLMRLFENFFVFIWVSRWLRVFLVRFWWWVWVFIYRLMMIVLEWVKVILFLLYEGIMFFRWLEICCIEDIILVVVLFGVFCLFVNVRWSDVEVLIWKIGVYLLLLLRDFLDFWFVLVRLVVLELGVSYILLFII